MVSRINHLYLFIDGQKQIAPYSKRYLEILFKDKDDNLLGAIRENPTLANKDLQDCSALLVALRKANKMGASHITVVTDNSCICSQLNDKKAAFSDMNVGDFLTEAKKLFKNFDSVTVKLA